MTIHRIRCDRQLPCQTCVTKGNTLSCTYAPHPQHKTTTVSVGERIQQLESLVRSLMQQQQQQQQQQQELNTPDDAVLTSSRSLEHENLRLHSHGPNYVSNVHWAAILDSISDLNDTYETEREAAMEASHDNTQELHPRPGPRLFYEPVQATKDEIISSLPSRAAVDRMVSRYFNTQGVAPGIFFDTIGLSLPRCTS